MATQRALGFADLAAGLDEDQREAVCHDGGPLLVVAGAGSGKSRAIVHRIARLVRDTRVDPRRILAVTFTARGAEVMSERTHALLGHSRAKIQTFHALCRAVLARETADFETWAREVDTADARYEGLLGLACGRQHLKWEGSDVALLKGFTELAKAEDAWPGSERARQIAQARHRFYGARGSDPAKTLAAFEIAERLRVERCIMTFADWMVETVRLLEGDEDLRVRLAGRYDHVLVDEGQDNSGVQARIARALARDHRNLVLVGDIRQAIYAFRGADPGLFLDFPREWGARVIHLRTNYRSGTRIVAASNAVSARMDLPPEMQVVARGHRADPGRVVGVRADSPDLEAHDVAAWLTELHAQGVAWRDCAVLVRTRACTRAVEEACATARVPYRVWGGCPFYELPEARALLAYLRVATKVATLADVACSLKTPARYIPRDFWPALEQAVERAARAAQQGTRATWLDVINQAGSAAGWKSQTEERLVHWVTMIEALQRRAQAGAPPSELLESVLQETDFVASLARESGRETPDDSRGAVVAELQLVAARFGQTADLLAHAEAATEAARAAARAPANGDRVFVATVHSCKGMEFKRVALIRCSAGILPHARAEDVEEERRLFYVALTRAMDEFRVSWCDSDDSGNGAMSPFVEDLDRVGAIEMHGAYDTDPNTIGAAPPEAADVATDEDVPFEAGDAWEPETYGENEV